MLRYSEHSEEVSLVGTQKRKESLGMINSKFNLPRKMLVRLSLRFDLSLSPLMPRHDDWIQLVVIGTASKGAAEKKVVV